MKRDVTYGAEWFKDATQHLLGDVDVKGADVELDGPVLGQVGGYVRAGEGLTVLLGLGELDDDGYAQQTLTGQRNRLRMGIK